MQLAWSSAFEHLATCESLGRMTSSDVPEIDIVDSGGVFVCEWSAEGVGKVCGSQPPKAPQGGHKAT